MICYSSPSCPAVSIDVTTQVSLSSKARKMLTGARSSSVHRCTSQEVMLDTGFHIIKPTLSTEELTSFSHMKRLLTQLPFSRNLLKHRMQFMVPTDLFSFTKMALIPLAHGLIPNSSPLSTGLLVATPFVLVELLFTLLLASLRLSSWLSAIGLRRLGRFISEITPVSMRPFNSLHYIIPYDDLLPQLLCLISSPPPPHPSPLQPSFIALLS